MSKNKVGITLSDETLEVLNKLCVELGLTKSQAISYLINTYYINKKGSK